MLLTYVWCIGMVLFLMTGCSNIGQLVPRCLYEDEVVGANFWLNAPYIVVGKVVESKWASSKTIADSDERTLRLVQTVLDLENDIKGDLASRNRRIVVYCYSGLPTNGPKRTHTTSYWLFPGERHVLFLRADGEHVRCMADHSPLRVQVHTGRHTQNDIDTRTSVSQKLARVMLFPGEGVNPAVLNENIEADVSVVESLVATGDLVEGLQFLMRYPDPQIEASGCLVAAKEFFGFDACLSHLTQSNDVRVRREAARMDLNKRNIATSIANTLMSDPLSRLARRNAEDIAAELSTYIESSNPEVHSAACRTFRRLFSERKLKRCE